MKRPTRLTQVTRASALISLLVSASLAQGQSNDSGAPLRETISEGEIRYVTDIIRTPVRSGAGADYRILNRGLPSGTAVTYFSTSEDGVWAEVETAGGTRGWLRAQYLQTGVPIANQLNEIEQALAAATERAELAEGRLRETENLALNSNEATARLTRDLTATEEELNNIKRISANAIELDRMNQSMTMELEEIKARVDVLKLENARLEERASSNRLLQGIFAVIVGVIIALVVPRFSGKRRRFDTWR
ncbi:MAG: TIGR04211 family SH3 domain-containing protein [Luminiphilus sp.]|nr:TIGR04211 family SH3 domain-containing protein [Luminiphilus sp.]